MGGIAIDAVMDGLAARLATIAGTDLQVFAFPPDSISPPVALVAYPEPLSYSAVMARGADRATFPVHVAVGTVSDRSARDALAPYVNGAGPKSVRAAIEADKTLGGAAQTLRVAEANVQFITVGGVEYLAATFNVDVVA